LFGHKNWERKDTSKKLNFKDFFVILHPKTNRFMKKVILLGVIVALFGISCKKSSDSGGGANVVTDPYMTTAAGTTWNYKTHDNVTGADTNSITTSTNKDTTLFGKSYHMFNDLTVETNQTDTTYMSQLGNDYYQLASLSAQIDPFEMKYLSSSAAVGESWPNSFSSTSSGTTITATIKNTIEERGGSVTIGSKTYTNVIKVKTDITNANIQVSIPPFGTQNITPTIIQDVHSYFAPKYGAVKRDYKLKITAGFLGQVQTVTDMDKSTTLTSSSIQ
jgi:hypothetical protein